MAKKPYPPDMPRDEWPEEDWDIYDVKDPNAGPVEWPEDAPDEG